MAQIEMNELKNEVTLSEDELTDVRGGLASNNLKQIGLALHSYNDIR